MAAKKPPPISRMNRRLAINRATAAVRNALIESGVNPNQALTQAQLALSHAGIKITTRGQIVGTTGHKYTPAQFINSPMMHLVSGATARAQNEKAIAGEPGYLQALATLGLNRDQALAGLTDTRNQSLIQFGDPNFAAGDRLTAGAAAANPFSTSRLQQLAYERAQTTTANEANRLGTFYGGGGQSGQQEDQRQNAAAVQDAVIKLTQLLSQIAQQEGLAQQAYNVGKGGAHLDAYNSLLASGGIHAANPHYQVGPYNVIRGYAPPSTGSAGGRGGLSPTGNPNPSYPTTPPPTAVPTANAAQPAAYGAAAQPNLYQRIYGLA